VGVDEVADPDRLEEGHLVHRRRDGRPTRVTLRHSARDVVDEFHDHASVHGTEQVGVERRHDP
jgi:hypothetical protein